MKPVLFGLVAGLAAAMALGRLLAAQLYQTSPHNPLLLAATAGILAFGCAARLFISSPQGHPPESGAGLGRRVNKF
jgi:hypothetical protein